MSEHFALLEAVPARELLGGGDVMCSGWEREQRRTGPRVRPRTRGATSVPPRWLQAGDQTRRVAEGDLAKENQS